MSIGKCFAHAPQAAKKKNKGVLPDNTSAWFYRATCIFNGMARDGLDPNPQEADTFEQ